jgi:hypothetical protein
MDQIHTSDKQIGDAEKKEIIIVHKSPGVPSNHKNAPGYENTEYFDKTMKKKVIVKTG